MSDHAMESMWKIVFALFNIVLLPLLYLLLRPIIEELVDRWKFRRTKAIKLLGQWKDKKGFVYNMTALLFLEPCEFRDGDHTVKGMIESELIEAPKEFSERYTTYPLGSIAFETVKGHCDKKLVLNLTTEAITDKVLLTPCTYTITIKDRRTFTGTSAEIGDGSMGKWEGTVRVR